MSDTDWDPRHDEGFWRRVAIAAGVPPAVVLGMVFAPGAVVGVSVAYIAKNLPELFKSEERRSTERAEVRARRILRRGILRDRMATDEEVTTWMRVVRAYYEGTTPEDEATRQYFRRKRQ